MGPTKGRYGVDARSMRGRREVNERSMWGRCEIVVAWIY